mgnify:CR=1 FL=1
MSLIYKVLGVPRTFDEFVDGLDKDKKDDIDIYFKESFNLNPLNLISPKPGLYEYSAECGVVNNRHKLKLCKKKIVMPLKYSKQKMQHAREHGLYILEAAIDFADLFREWGYRTTINGNTPERVRQKKNFLELRLDDVISDSIVL